MLYNPDWNKTKANPFALDTLIAWAEKQPPEAHYDYKNCLHCYLAQYFLAQGFQRVELSKNIVKSWDKGLILSLPRSDILPQLFNWIAEEVPHTFGAAAERARKARDNPAACHAQNFRMNFAW